MSSRLEYEIATSLLEANIKLNEQEHVYALMMVGVTEAAELESLNEGFAEIVRGYMNKVMQNTQNTWTKFKNRISEKVSEMLLSKYKPDEIKKALSDDSVAGVPISNYSDYDLDKLGNYDIKELNYATMKGNLGSVDDFLKANYRDIYGEEKADLKAGLRKLISGQKEESHTLTNDEMRKIGDFVLTNYKNLQRRIEDNIKRLNQSADAVESLISVSKESSVLTLEDTTKMYFLEVEKEDDGKMKIASEPKEDGGESGNSNSELKSHIMNYMKATTQVLTAQMSIANEILMLYTRILLKYMSNWKSGQKKEDGSSSGDENKSTDNSKIQKIQ